MAYHGVHCMLSTEVLVLLTYLTLDMYFMFVFPFTKIHPGNQQTIVNLTSVLIDGLLVLIHISKQEPVFRLWWAGPDTHQSCSVTPLLSWTG